MAVSELDTMSKDQKEWEMNFTRLKTQWDYNALKHIAEKNGREAGVKEGMKAGMEKGMSAGLSKGLSQAKTEDARNLKHLGVSAEIISKATGFTAEEIEKL